MQVLPIISLIQTLNKIIGSVHNLQVLCAHIFRLNDATPTLLCLTQTFAMSVSTYR